MKELLAPFPWFGGKANARRERIWFSPHCLPEREHGLW